MQNEVIISQKFKEQVDGLNVYTQIQKKCEAAFKGNILKLDDELYILKDEKNNDICGILDSKSFLEAIQDTDVSHLWTFDNTKRVGTAN